MWTLRLFFEGWGHLGDADRGDSVCLYIYICVCVFMLLVVKLPCISSIIHPLFTPFLLLQKEQLIKGALRVLGNTAELIDTTDNVFTFKYTGQVCNREGIEAWTLQMIQDSDPSVKKVLMLTNRKRDKRD